MKKTKSYGDLTKLNKCGDLLGAIDRDTLERIGHSYLDLLETSSAIYEVDGSYATALFTSSYCKLLDRSSRSLCGTENNQEALDSGKWLCHESCWTKASRVSIKTGKPYDLRPCAGGINIYAIPIKAKDRIIGSINFGYGSPPTDEKTIDELARSFKINKKDLLQTAREYNLRPEYVIEAAKKHLHLAAELIGELYLHEKTEKELESFSYSVSHDLRAPLRALDEFSKFLLRDYSDKLDERGKDFLGRIRKASQTMAKLIDALLILSRVGRAELTRERVDLSELANAIAHDLKRAEPKRRIEFHIKKGLVAKGDKRLLLIVLENLMDNAWKYTSKTTHAEIEFGVTQHNGESVYFVRDNGAGFDMEYADKLFGAFQRLHATEEFEGIGIGLATVNRIINRHAGRIWGEGKVNEGAIFYFNV